MTNDEINREVERIIFGDGLTANTEKHIINAVSMYIGATGPEFILNSGHRIDMSECPDVYRGLTANDNYTAWIWFEREGKPYQSAIEQHVTDYRRQPRPFCTDWNLLPMVCEVMRFSNTGRFKLTNIDALCSSGLSSFYDRLLHEGWTKVAR